MNNEIENTETEEPVATEPETMLDKLLMQDKSSWSDIPKYIFLQGMINFLKKSIENIKTLEKVP